MAYVTETELRARLPEMDNPAHAATITPAWVAAVIDTSDRWVRMKVLPLVSAIAAITDTPPTPDSVRMLALANACREALIRMFGRGRTPLNNADIEGFEKERDEILAEIEGRQVADLQYIAQLESNYRDDGRKPDFGQGKFGEHVEDDTPYDSEDGYEMRERT
jgi:hypothetical protein